MSEDIIAALKENVIQGRQNKDDEGIEEDMAGTPGVVELTEAARNSPRKNTTFQTCWPLLKRLEQPWIY
jgi:hypothetical protein